MYWSSALLGLLAAAPLALAHGVVMEPATREPGEATAKACGQDLVDFYKADNTSYPGALKRQYPQYAQWDAAKCNLFLCRGFQYDDNTHQVQSYKPGEVVSFKVWIRIPHSGIANVSVVDARTNTLIGTPLIHWTKDYAATLNPPVGQTHFNVTIPDDLGDQCVTPGTCVLQWYWLGQGQTFESCVDFATPKAKMLRA